MTRTKHIDAHAGGCDLDEADRRLAELLEQHLEDPSSTGAASDEDVEFVLRMYSARCERSRHGQRSIENTQGASLVDAAHVCEPLRHGQRSIENTQGASLVDAAHMCEPLHA
jgi:hypothetical protein